MTLLLATRNAHKVAEMCAMLGDHFQFLDINDFPAVPKVVENANTFAGNAAKKSVELAEWFNFNNSKCEITNSKPDFVLADDSGLEVDALGGAPGVHSARFAAMDSATSGNAPDTDNNTKLLRLLKDVPLEKRTARFRCVLALTPAGNREPGVENMSPVCYANEFETPTKLFDGVCEGKIIFEPRGKNGFGYDPLFAPDGFKQTFAELGDAVKNKLSHRAKALEKLLVYLSKLPS
jgi:XTP/dITP diphosphohydrolase